MEILETKSETFAEGLAAKLEDLEEQFLYNYSTLVTKKLAELKTSLTQKTACPDGWTSFQNSCYTFGHESVQFLDAESYCETLNAHLVNIETPEENYFIREQLKQLKEPRFWIGMTDVEQEGSWKHYPSNKDVTFFDWGKYQPNNGRASNCAAFWESFSMLWVDEPCTNKFIPLCEKEINATTL